MKSDNTYLVDEDPPMIYPESMNICFKGNQASFKELHTIIINYFLTRAGFIVLFPSRGCGSAEGGRENLQD